MNETELPLLIGGLLVAMTFSAFFSGMEIAFVSSNRMLAEMERENRNSLVSRALKVFYRHPSNFVSTMLVGNNIALVIYGILFARLFDNTLFQDLNAGARVTADTLLSTLVVLFTGEFLPKTFFKSNPNRLLTFFAPAAWLCYVILWPVSRFSTTLARGLMRLTGIRLEKENEDEEFSKVDLDYLVQSSIDNARDDTEIDSEVRIFQNALDFSELRVRDSMKPRTEIDAVEDTATLAELKALFVESGHSKIIVYHEDIDHIVGYVHSYDLFGNTDADTVSVANSHLTVRQMPFVPETMNGRKLMRIFTQQKKSLAVVVDEFGGTSGIVSLEDIVEEIFGDIEDEHDNSSLICKQLSENEYLLSARLEIDKVNERFSLSLPESDEYMTVGGLILHEYQSFPKLNETVRVGTTFEFRIIKNTMTKIELVRLKVTPAK